jgi:hypothetical protein
MAGGGWTRLPAAHDRIEGEGPRALGGALTEPPRRRTQSDAASHTNPSGSVKGPASLPTVSR